MAIKSLAQSTVRQAPPVNSMLAGYTPGSFHHLETVRLSASAASIEFTNLARYSDYQHFQIRAVARSTNTGTRWELAIRINGDSGNNYAGHSLYGFNGTVNAGVETGVSRMSLGWAAGNSLDSRIYTPFVVDFLDPFEAKNKTFRSLTGLVSDGLVGLLSGLWTSTASSTSLTVYPISGNWATGSRFSLYGIKARA